jgi:hypothetical protein
MGFGLQGAADYVRCSVNTIRREAERNPQFRDEIRHAEENAELSPLRAMQRAIHTHWRAAAWFIERAFPERFARPGAGTFAPREIRQLRNDLLEAIHSEITTPESSKRIDQRVRSIFQHHIHLAAQRISASRRIRLEINAAEEKNRRTEPLAAFDPCSVTDDPPNFDGMPSFDWPGRESTKSASITPPSQPDCEQTSINPTNDNTMNSNIP